MFTADHRGLQPLSATVIARPKSVGPEQKEADDETSAITAAAALFAAASMAASLGAATSKPYIGTWKARMTKAQLIDEGFVDPRAWVYGGSSSKQDGTYRAFNPLDRWTSGEYSAGADQARRQQRPACLAAGFKGPGIYRWSVKAGRLKLDHGLYGQ